MVLVNVSLSLENQSITSGAGVSVSDVESAGGTTNTALFGQLMHAAQGEGGKTLPPTAVAERLGISLEQLQQLLAQLGQEVAQQASAQAAAVARGEDAAVAASASEAPPPEDAEAFLLWRGVRPPSAQVLREMQQATA